MSWTTCGQLGRISLKGFCVNETTKQPEVRLLSQVLELHSKLKTQKNQCHDGFVRTTFGFCVFPTKHNFVRASYCAVTSAVHSNRSLKVFSISSSLSLSYSAVHSASASGSSANSATSSSPCHLSRDLADGPSLSSSTRILETNSI